MAIARPDFHDSLENGEDEFDGLLAEVIIARSTMEDVTTRRKEIEAITALLDKLVQPASRLLEIGCGNGVLLDVLRTRYRSLELTGRDFSRPMVELAQSRDLENCDVAHGDVRSLDFEDETFELIVGERVIINLMDRGHQWEAFAEVARVLIDTGAGVLGRLPGRPGRDRVLAGAYQPAS